MASNPVVLTYDDEDSYSRCREYSLVIGVNDRERNHIPEIAYAVVAYSHDPLIWTCVAGSGCSLTV